MGTWVARSASSQGCASWEKGMRSLRGGRVDFSGIVAISLESGTSVMFRDRIPVCNSASSSSGARLLSGAGLGTKFRVGLHHAIRLTISSHSSKLMNSSNATFSWSSDDSCINIFGSKDSANSLRIACPNNFVALIDLWLDTSRNSYVPVTMVSDQPISTIIAARRPAATVVSAGVACKEIFGD